MASQEEDDQEAITLSTDTLAALQDFYHERDARQKRFEELKYQAEDKFDGKNQLSMEDFAEDWNTSQFWYKDATAVALAEQLLADATDQTYIAVVSAPSVFIQLKNLIAAGKCAARPSLTLLEYDNRFAVFKEFEFYDYQQPLRLPETLKGKFDRIICDPPFLSEECQTKAALTVRWLAKNWTTPEIHEDVVSSLRLRILVCTGERMKDLVEKLYGKAGVFTTTYEIQHAKGLSNEFRCYSNFESHLWRWAKDTRTQR